jgi:hypothetical protein
MQLKVGVRRTIPKRRVVGGGYRPLSPLAGGQLTSTGTSG